MRILLTILILCWSGLTLVGQEICDNGVDDDGDGLTDIYDPECICQGILSSGLIEDVIGDPNFEDMLCCPPWFSAMDCVEGWEQGTTATTDYLNTCGFVLDAVVAAGLVPFPSGEGCLGTIITNFWAELLATCLLQPLEANYEYTLTFQIASLPVDALGDVCNNGIPNYDPIFLTLYGNAGCKIPVSTTGCPSAADPSWIVLGTVLYTPLAQWGEVSITFTPSTNINSIMIGGPCNLPPGYSGSPCFPYFLFDDLVLTGDIKLFELDLYDFPCDENYLLFAEVDDQGPGTWQWYFNGAAILGQNDPEFYVANNNFQSGTYCVTYSTPNGCVMDSIAVTVLPKDTAVEQVYFCPGGNVDCAGETFFIPGLYEVYLTSFNGCDSVVECIVAEFDPPPITYLSYDICGPVEIQVCGELFNTSGQYQINCLNWRGCDSIIILDLRVMDPKAVIQTPGLLDCAPNADVVLDGSLSSVNPISGGSTFFEWSGPINGILGNKNAPVVMGTKTGKYCLVVTHESNGVLCMDTTCVTVTSASAVPNAPVLSGDSHLCILDTAVITPSSGGGAQQTGYSWIFNSSLNAVIVNNQDLQYVPSGAGLDSFCVVAYNECGASDTACFIVITHPSDTLLIEEVTCDPAQEGISTKLFVNLYGCDSLVISNKVLHASEITYQVMTTCDSAIVGIDSTWHQNLYGCDSLSITTIDLRPSHLIKQTFYTCDPTQAGLDTLYLTNQFGCDSTIFIERIYSGNYQETNQTLICGAGINYTDTLLVTSGPCDSLFITNYQYDPLDTTWVTASTCDPTQAGMTIAVQPSSLGCDSTIITSTSLFPSDTTLVSGVTCDPAGAIYTVTVLSNQYGCDSVVTTDIQYVGIDTLYLQKTTCDPAQVGTVVAVLPGVECDTIQVTETTWVPFTQSEETIILCGQTGILSDTIFLQNSAGCDSLAIRYYEYVSLISQFQIQGETCAGDQYGRIEIINISGGQAPFVLQLNAGGWQSATVFSNLPPGQYTIYIRDAAGCRDTLSGLVITPGASLDIDAGPDRISTQGEIINLSAQTTQSLWQVQWTANDPLSCPGCLQTTLGPLTTNQTVVVTGWTLDGCSDSHALEVIIKTRGNIFIPNSFTPNGDGINDVFFVYGNDQISRIRNLAIFDRWGNALYARSDLPINDPSAGWDGTFRDEVMDPGVYIYVVEVELIDGSVRLYKGDVTLVR